LYWCIHQLAVSSSPSETLAEFDERKSGVVEPRFFGGLSGEETATVEVSPETVMRDWKLARVRVMREVRHAG
jgi:hypothetical protein